MMKKTIIVAVFLTSAAGLLGHKAVSSHLVTLRQEVRASVREATPVAHEINRIKSLIYSMSQDVLAFREKIGEIDTTAVAQLEDIRELRDRLASDRADLLAERNLLAQPGEAFQIRGTPYSRAQVEASAQARMARILRDEAALESKNRAVERLQSAVHEGQARLQQAIAIRDSKIQELDVLTADLANAELQRDLEALAAPLRNNVLGRSQNELAESMKAFADRVREAKREVDAVQSTSLSALIAHEASSAPALTEQIDRLLDPSSASAQKIALSSDSGPEPARDAAPRNRDQTQEQP